MSNAIFNDVLWQMNLEFRFFSFLFILSWKLRFRLEIVQLSQLCICCYWLWWVKRDRYKVFFFFSSSFFSNSTMSLVFDEEKSMQRKCTSETSFGHASLHFIYIHRNRDEREKKEEILLFSQCISNAMISHIIIIDTLSTSHLSN